jgi:Fur family zinc uptake transcriptional regulator
MRLSAMPWRLARHRAGAISAEMTQSHISDAFPAPEHDHDLCLETAMERARRAFDDKGLKLTPLRRAVFGEIASSHRAIGAYEVLDKLAARGERLAPISIYRAIDALLTAGMVHRVESRNAFFACHAGHDRRSRQLVLGCEICGRIAEVEGDKAFAVIDKAATSAGFSAKGAVVEVWGQCADCAARSQEPVA